MLSLAFKLQPMKFKLILLLSSLVLLSACTTTKEANSVGYDGDKETPVIEEKRSSGQAEEFNFVDADLLPEFNIPKNWYYSSEYSAGDYYILFDTEDIADIEDRGFWTTPIVMILSKNIESHLGIENTWVESKDVLLERSDLKNGTLTHRIGYQNPFELEFKTEYYNFVSNKNNYRIELARFHGGDTIISETDWSNFLESLNFENIDL
jgi:hypothetical protein